MNLDELKTTWKEYDRKLQSTQAINEKIINSMIAERSKGRFDKVRRQYILSVTWMFICFAFGVLVIFTNPFDYDAKAQFIPIAIFASGLVILMGGLISRYRALRKITFSHHNIAEALQKIITVYERPRRFLYYTVVLFLFSQIVLFPLSFVPRNIDAMGLWPALAEVLIPISVALIMLAIAYKFGAFKVRHVDNFREDLTELEELRAMSAELGQEN